MRVLVVADIHGNRAALEAIQEPFDACVCIGDLVDYGPEPGPCVEWVRENALYCVRGNHDHGVAQDVAVSGVAGFRFLTSITRPLTVAALTANQRRYLADLPTSRMFSIGGKTFLLVHATPRDPMDEYALPDKAFWAPRIAGLHVDYILARPHAPALHASGERHEDREPRQRRPQSRWRSASRLRDHRRGHGGAQAGGVRGRRDDQRRGEYGRRSHRPRNAHRHLSRRQLSVEVVQERRQ